MTTKLEGGWKGVEPYRFFTASLTNEQYIYNRQMFSLYIFFLTFTVKFLSYGHILHSRYQFVAVPNTRVGFPPLRARVPHGQIVPPTGLLQYWSLLEIIYTSFCMSKKSSPYHTIIIILINNNNRIIKFKV